MREQVKKFAYTLLGAAIIAIVWQIAAAAYAKPLLLPAPKAAFRALGRELTSALFWRSFGFSLFRSLCSSACACVLAIVCAFLGKAFAPVRYVLSPVVGVLRAVPTMSVILLLVIWIGGNGTPLIVSGLVIFPVLYSGVWGALSGIDAELTETARLYAGRPVYTFFRVYLPMSAPAFLHTAGGAASLTLKLTVAAEVLAPPTHDGIGTLMQQARIYFQGGRLMALTVAVIAASLLIEFCAYALRKAIDYRE